jgi:hypothetical protein
LFQRLKSASKLWSANQAASRIRPLIAACLFTASAPDGGFDSRLQSDEFVVGYIYGVITACDKSGDHEEQGYFVRQVFELCRRLIETSRGVGGAGGFVTLAVYRPSSIPQ